MSATNDFIVGLDLGQASDHTAIAIVEKTVVPFDRATRTQQHHKYHCGFLEQMPLGTLYPVQVARVVELMESPALGYNKALVVDATGVGRPVVDMLRAARLSPTAVMVTGGATVSHKDGFVNVPKRELVSITQILLQSGRLTIAESLPKAKTLIQEMLSFQVKITESANDTYGAWREGAHDDLLFALMLAVWKGEKHSFSFASF
jgi:hypothetical protein